MSLVEPDPLGNAGTASSRLLSSWPLAGRAEELELLADAIGSASTPRDNPRGAVIVAPSGMGKTRLAREASLHARKLGFTPLWAVGTAAAAMIPYGALAHLAPTVSPSSHADAVSFHTAFITALTTDGESPLLVVDDAQLLDHGSAALLLRIALTGAAVVIATVRAGEPAPDPIAALWRDGITHRLDMQPLRREEASSMVRAALGGAISEPVLHRLYDVTGGSPLHIREFVLAAVEAGSLSNRDGTWSWDGEVPLPTRLADAIGGRLDALTTPERRALAVLALGEPLEPRLAERVCDGAALVALERAGMVRRVSQVPGTTPKLYRLGHPLLGEVALSRETPDVRRELLLSLATAASQQLLDGAARIRLARWQLDAGVAPEPATLVSAAQYASSVFAHEEARRLAEAAVDQGADVEATVTLAAALVGLGRFHEAAERLAGVEAAALADPRDSVRLTYLDRSVAALFHGLGQDEEAEALLDRFRDCCKDPHSRRLEVALRAMVALESGRVREAADRALEVLQDVDALEFTKVIAGEVAGEALIYLGQTGAAQAAHNELRTIAAAGGPAGPKARRSAALQESMCQLQEGNLEQAGQLMEENYRTWVPGYDDISVGLAAFGVGTVNLMRGRPASALKFLREAAACLHRADLDGTLAWVLAATAQAEAKLGDGDAASATLERALHRPMAARRSRSRLDFALAEVCIRAARGDATGGARLALERAALDLTEFPVHRARLLHAGLRLGAPATTVAPLLAAAARECACRLPQLLSEHADALVARDPDSLDRASQRLEEFGLTLEAAEAAAEAGRILGSGPAAERARARSSRLASLCEGVRTQALVSAADLPVLTRREREVAQLAAQGLSSPAIAERLVLSVRTVESHLYQVFAKLGVRRREEIAPRLGADDTES